MNYQEGRKVSSQQKEVDNFVLCYLSNSTPKEHQQAFPALFEYLLT